MRAYIPVLLVALVACQRGPTITNHDPSSPEITGLVRLTDEGGYTPGHTERFRALYSVDGAATLRFSASGGEVTQAGDEVAWTLPDAQLATLTLAIDAPRHQATATFRFALTGAPGSTGLVQAAAAGVVDASTDATGSVCDLQLDGSGSPVIIYRNDVHPALWYATWSGTAWQTQLVDGMGYELGGTVDKGMTLVLAANGTPHIAYVLENNQLWYATRSGGGWLHERLDSSALPLHSESSHAALALDPSHAGRPTVVYEAYNGGSGYQAVAVAVRNGAGSWTDTLLTPGPPTGYAWSRFNGGLAISPGGVVYFSFSDGSFRLGAWTGSATTYATLSGVALSDDVRDAAPVVLGAQATPLAMYAHALAHVTPGASLADATYTVSPYEEGNVRPVALAVDGAGSPWMAFDHSGLELAHVGAGGYWDRLQLGPMDPGGRPSIAVDSAGGVHACFFRDGKLMLY